MSCSVICLYRTEWILPSVILSTSMQSCCRYATLTAHQQMMLLKPTSRDSAACAAVILMPRWCTSAGTAAPHPRRPPGTTHSTVRRLYLAGRMTVCFYPWIGLVMRTVAFANRKDYVHDASSVCLSVCPRVCMYCFAACGLFGNDTCRY